jgi:hypothetical protein
MRTFSAVMFWWIREGLFALYPCKYAIPVHAMKNRIKIKSASKNPI